MVVNENWVAFAFPVNRIWRIGYDRFKRLIVPVPRIYKRITERDVKLIVVDIVKEHVNAAKVVSRDVNFLAIKTLADIIATENLCKFKEK